jgi:FKBP-type peptidyl-prolyl cis-trans isomerase FklB
MKRLVLLPLLLTAGQLVAAPANTVQLVTDSAKQSYSIGYDFGQNIQQNLSDIELKLFINGLEDAFQKKAPQMKKEDMAAAIQTYREKLMAKQQKEQESKSLSNKKASEEFLAANKAKKGVVTLPSGLQYVVLADGTGKSPSAEDTVTVHYRGTLINGEEFDSSYRRNEPATFAVSGVIKGWTEALQLMKEGAKWQLFIPPQLAYGERGMGSIGPNELLIFEVELVKVAPKQ